MSWIPTPDTDAKLEAVLACYPDRKAACIPALHMVQDELGWIPDESIAWVSGKLGLSRSQVEGVATFYSMFRRSAAGRFHLELCTNISCSLCGAEQVLAALEKELGIRAGETTEDGLFTLHEVECLATCGTGPALQVGDEIHERLTPDRASEIVASLRKKA